MSAVGGVKSKILAGNVVGLQADVTKIVAASSVGAEGQQIIRICSRFVYENQKVHGPSFAAVLEIIKICCKHQQEHIASDPFFHLKSMYYIILLAARRKDLHQHLIGLLSIMEPYIELCDASIGEALNMVKHMYQIVWNTSLTVTPPLNALTLQRFAFQYTLAVGSSVSQVCDQAVKAHVMYENTEKSADILDRFYEPVLKYLITALNKQKTCNEDTAVAVVNLVMEYAKVVMRYNQCVAFSKHIKTLMKLLEPQCEQVMVVALKGGLKLPEVAMALRLGKCGEEMLRKMIGACAVVAAKPGPNSILLLGLLTALEMVEQPSCLNPTITSSLLEVVMKRCKAPLFSDIAKKVANVLYQQLAGFFSSMESCSEPDSLLSQVLAWAHTIRPFIENYCCGKPDRIAALYNFAAQFGNFGSVVYRKNKYDVAAKFLEIAVDLLDQCHTHAPQAQKKDLFTTLNKKMRLWSDTLRYGGQHWEAGVVAGRGFLRGCLTVEDLVTLWVKCKRDAEKSGSKTLKGVTVCDVVREAGKRHQEAEGIVFDQVAALLSEIQCYKQQNYNTVEEQLICGRAVAAAAADKYSVEARVRGLLAVTEALWVCPYLASGDKEATETIQQARDVLQEAKSGGKTKPVLMELEALVHFWQYLCYLQVIYNKADAEVKESKKPNPMTASVSAPGEEEQVHDVCDVRPTALLTLHTQQASLTPLHTALDIWDKFVSQNLPLEDASITCATIASVGYVYQLSGQVTPTLQAWGLLVSLARQYSLQNFLIKGLVELLMVAPELVDEALVREAEHVVASASDTQDSSQSCLMVMLTAAIAFYNFKTGQYESGARLVHTALQSEVMCRRTVRTTEVQTLVHLVASLYAWLPPWKMPQALTLPAPCFLYAMLACRQANGLLVVSLTDFANDVICWRHRVAGLLFTTTAWLGHLSVITAQPRIARVYMEKALQLSQQLVLPLRIAEFLELLARVDILCDQLEDCRVKVDSLLGLLVTHPSHQEETDTLTSEFTKLSITKSTKGMRKKGHQIFCDPTSGSGERMRTESGAGDFTLRKITDLHAVICVDPKEGGGGESWNPSLSLSPSLSDREKLAVVKFPPCSSGGVECALCSSPIIHHLRISSIVHLALIHAHAERYQAAHRCLAQAKKMYSDAVEKADKISTHLESLLRGDEVKLWTVPPAVFVHSRLNLVHLQTFHAHAKVLALEGKWDKALTASLEALQKVASKNTLLMVQDMHQVALLCLQGRDIEKVLTRLNETPKDDIQDITSTQMMDDEVCHVTTPEVSERKKSIQRLLDAPKHINRKNLIFNIYSDEEEDSNDQTKAPKAITPHQKDTKTPGKRFFKSARKKPPGSSSKIEETENKKVLNSLKADWNDDNLQSLVLQVPSDLPLSPLNATSHATEEGVGKGLPSSPITKSRNRAVSKSKTTATKDEGVTKIPQGAEGDKGEMAAPRSRGRPSKVASRVSPLSTSKTKKITVPKSSTRSRTARSLRNL